MTLEEALAGTSAPPEIQDAQRLVDVEFWDFSGDLQSGQIVVHEIVVSEVKEIFEVIKGERFPLQSVIPTVAFGWSDDDSMAANNSSGFNYRPIVGGGRVSWHGHGLAIDLNPVQNPYVKGSLVLPPGATYDLGAAGVLTAGSSIVQAFLSRGWGWGGDWHTLKDWQHFEKPTS